MGKKQGTEKTGHDKEEEEMGGSSRQLWEPLMQDHSWGVRGHYTDGQREHLGEGATPAWMDCKKELWTECVLPKFMWWSPNLQCDGVKKWGLWKVIRFRSGHEGGAPMMGLVLLRKRVIQGLTFSLHFHAWRKGQVGTQWEGSIYNLRTSPFWHLDRGLPSLLL